MFESSKRYVWKHLSGPRFVFVVATVVAFCCAGAWAQGASDKAQIAHGRYLVQQVGMCNDCHTPFNDKGPVPGKELQGTVLPFKPTVPMPAWAASSPAIAGLPQFPDDASAVTFFMTGKDAGGKNPRPPMPGYRFNKKDASAIVAYLRSLAPEKNK
jgi:mono/diheme cytochrome c family protein